MESKDGKIKVRSDKFPKRILAGIRKGPEMDLDYAEVWNQFTGDPNFPRLMEFGGEMAAAVISMNEDGEAEYMAGTFITDRYNAEDLEFDVLEIPGGTYLAAETIGPVPQSIHNAWEYIFSDVLSTGKYGMTNIPSLEVYPQGKDMSGEDYVMEIEVPVTVAGEEEFS